jgi:hypothetical protein
VLSFYQANHSKIMPFVVPSLAAISKSKPAGVTTATILSGFFAFFTFTGAGSVSVAIFFARPRGADISK